MPLRLLALPFVTKVEIAFEGARDMSPRSRDVGIGEAGPMRAGHDWGSRPSTSPRISILLNGN
jgi:hypothetical protein